MSEGYFVTGTDTGVGKTVVACGLLRAFANQGKSAIGMKPVAAGCAEDGYDDVKQLLAASNTEAPRDLINPYALPLPVAPHIAAQFAGIDIDIGVIAEAYAQLEARSDIVIVEGVGGFKVPLNSHQDSADLARRLALPVILVVGMRLGCLNHALLTADSVRAHGLALAGWIANRVDTAMPMFEQNVRALEERLPCPRLATLAWQPDPQAPRTADALSLTLLA
ncbi:MAG: dethiobiotin synthase [Burkholderiales bacterium]|nr:dethiobiotin synthase [Burkholderiales bacterium]